MSRQNWKKEMERLPPKVGQGDRLGRWEARIGELGGQRAPLSWARGTLTAGGTVPAPGAAR